MIKENDMKRRRKLNEFIVTEDDFDPEENFVACVYGPPITFYFKCDKCGNEWKSFMTYRKTCPKCGTVCEHYKED